MYVKSVLLLTSGIATLLLACSHAAEVARAEPEGELIHESSKGDGHHFRLRNSSREPFNVYGEIGGDGALRLAPYATRLECLDPQIGQWASAPNVIGSYLSMPETRIAPSAVVTFALKLSRKDFQRGHRCRIRLEIIPDKSMYSNIFTVE
jgi:hypothetical protein